MGRRKQQKPKRAADAEDDLGGDKSQSDDNNSEDEDVEGLKSNNNFGKACLGDSTLTRPNFPADFARFSTDLAWLQWQHQAVLRENRMKLGIEGRSGDPEAPLDLSGNRLPGIGFNSLSPWQQHLLMLRDKTTEEREAANLALLTSSSTSPSQAQSLALLRSFAALSENMPQSTPSLNDLHVVGQQPTNLALSALHQISQLSNQISCNAARLPVSGPQTLLMQRPPLWSQVMLPPGGSILNSSVRKSKLEIAKDVLKCVACLESFTTLDGLTRHLKETGHSAQTQQPIKPPSFETRASLNNRPLSPPESPKVTSQKESQSSLPRKLVRGQDVWLGKGQEQTRQILKCMWCGQSFPSLADLTLHMQETKHYTKVISQEQIAAWNCSSVAADGKPPTTKKESNKLSGIAQLQCKVCNATSFSNYRDLNSHMANCRQTDEVEKDFVNKCKHQKSVVDRKKRSLPVRQLLEMERGCGSDAPDSKKFSIDDDLQQSITDQVAGNGTESILGSLEKLVESSFAEMKTRKRHLGSCNGILQRLGMDEEQVASKAEIPVKPASFMDFFRNSASWRSSHQNPDGSDHNENEIQIPTTRSFPMTNPLFALKELCNFSSARSGHVVNSDVSSPSSTGNGRSASSPNNLSTTTTDDLNDEVDVPSQFHQGCPDLGVVDSASIDDHDQKKDHQKDTLIGVHESQDYNRYFLNEPNSARSTRSRRGCRRTSSSPQLSPTPSKQPKKESGDSRAKESSSTVEGKFFRYSELAKELAAGN